MPQEQSQNPWDVVQVGNTPQSQPSKAPTAAAPSTPSDPWAVTSVGTPAPATQPTQQTTPPVQHYTAPPSAVTGTISAYKPSILERVENMFRYANPNTRPRSSEKDRNDDSMQIIRPEEFWSETEQANHPMATAIGQFAGGMTSADNVAIMLATEGLGAIPGMTSVGKAIIPRLISAGFSAQMLKGAYDKIPAIRQAWDRGDESEVKRLFTSMVLDSSMALLAGKHAAKGGPAVAGETQYEKAQRKVREEEIAVGGKPPVEPTPAAEPTPAQRGTVAGPETTLRPTTQTTAGVEAPIAAQQQDNQGAFTRWAQKVAKNMTTPGKAAEFQNAETKPAARQQMVSALSQVAEDKIAAHEALANGVEAPAPITGTQTPGTFETPDEIWPAMQQATEQTWTKAREASAREVEAWEREKAAAISAHSEGIDHYNQMVDNHNATLTEGDEPMQRQEFNPEDAEVPERPQTFDDLRTALKQAEANTAPGNPPDVITKAREVDVPKAEKALDKWFKDHEDVVSPAEYDSAKKLYADSFRYQEAANYLRSKLAKGTLTGGDIRGLEPAVDGKAIRRRGAAGVGEFRRLVGPEAYQNLQDVAKLFDPIEKNPNTPAGLLSSWGGSVAEYLLGGFVGHLLHAGPAGEAGGLAATAMFRSFMNKVLFDPDFGQSFKRVVNATRDAVATGRRVPADIMENMTGKLKDLVDAVKNSGEEGAVGNNVKKRRAGSPVPPKFGRQGLGGADESDQNQVNSHIANGGSTFDAKGNDMSGANLHTVVVNPERTAQVEGDLTPQHLRQFKTLNADLINKEGYGIGTWLDPDTNKHVLDVPKLIENRDEAIAAGKAANQKAIYHLGTQELIPTGGNGEIPGSVADAVAKYNESVGKPPVDDTKVPVDPRANAIADAYDKLKHEPTNPKVKKAYNALVKETKAQWEALKNAGYSIEPTDTDPYSGYEQMAEDIKNNKRIKVWTGGQPPADHPLSAIDPETGLSENTLFRAVHDIMGHVAGNNDFSQAGEENAYQRHAQSYSDAALPALTTETKGQTSHFFNSAKVRAGGTPDFVDQRAALLPERFQGRQTSETVPTYTNRADGIHEVSTGGEGYLLAEDVKPGVAQIKSHWVDESEQGKGIGSAQIQTLAQNLAENPNNHTLLSDTNMTDAAKGTWTKLMRQYPDAIKWNPDKDSEFSFDLDKLRSEGQKDYSQSEIATRRPTSVKADLTNNPLNRANLEATEQARPSRETAAGSPVMGYKEKMARTLAAYTGIDFTPEELENPDRVISKAVTRYASNLEWLYNQMPPELRETDRKWYDSAHELTNQFAKQYGVSHEQAAGVVAALSPQNPWDNNVGLAKRMMDINQNRQNFNFSPEMEQKAAELKKVPTQSKAFKGLLRDVAGKKLSEVKNDDPDVQAVQRALWMRLYDEAHNSSVNDQYAPNGDVSGHSPDNRSWVGLDHMAKAVKILADGSVKNINDVMGQGHKIRNFYNNIINPNSKNEHVTVDTHAVAAAHLQPFGAKDTEAVHNFGNTNPGIPGAPKDASTGLQGTYPIYAEAYQRVARKLGVLPRELQSVAWEAIKMLMGDEKKTPELKKQVKEIWQDVQDGHLTPEEAREKIKTESNGFSKPSWMSDEEWERLGPEGEDTSFNPEGEGK